MKGQGAIERTVTGLGYDLVDIEQGPRGLLRVFIDRVPGDPTGGFVTVDDCERVTRQLQHVLEVEGTAYERLEVSSPGLDRPLKKDSDYQRFAGQEVDLTLKLPFQGRKRYRGVLQQPEAPQAGAEEPEGPEHTTQPGWRLVFNDGKAEQALDFSLEEVREARLVPVLNFKGRAVAAPANDAPAGAANEVVDGGRKQ